MQLLSAACTPGEAGGAAPVVVVLGVRADFYEQCLGYPELADALQHRHMVLGPLTTAELREAVTGPAKAVGLELEPGLAELIVREVSADGPRGAHDAGVLPLLSHALLATWQRRKAGTADAGRLPGGGRYPGRGGGDRRAGLVAGWTRPARTRRAAAVAAAGPAGRGHPGHPASGHAAAARGRVGGPGARPRSRWRRWPAPGC